MSAVCVLVTSKLEASEAGNTSMKTRRPLRSGTAMEPPLMVVVL